MVRLQSPGRTRFIDQPMNLHRRSLSQLESGPYGIGATRARRVTVCIGERCRTIRRKVVAALAQHQGSCAFLFSNEHARRQVIAW